MDRTGVRLSRLVYVTACSTASYVSLAVRVRTEFCGWVREAISARASLRASSCSQDVLNNFVRSFHAYRVGSNGASRAGCSIFVVSPGGVVSVRRVIDVRVSVFGMATYTTQENIQGPGYPKRARAKEEARPFASSNERLKAWSFGHVLSSQGFRYASAAKWESGRVVRRKTVVRAVRVCLDSR